MRESLVVLHLHEGQVIELQEKESERHDHSQHKRTNENQNKSIFFTFQTNPLNKIYEKHVHILL
jgi:hypothetical protein